MLGIRSYYRVQDSIPQTIKEDPELDEDLEDMELCDENEFNNGMILQDSKSQEKLRMLHRLIVKRDGLKIRLPQHWEMDLIFTEILTKENFGHYGDAEYEIMLPFEIFMIENIHYKGLVNFKNILNLPNKIRGMSLTNKNGLKKTTQLISTTIASYVTWLIDLSFNTREEKRAYMKLFKSEYLVVTKSETCSKSRNGTMNAISDKILSQSENHLIYHIDIINSTVIFSVIDEKKLFKLIKFNLKRDFQRVQKFQNQIDIEFALKLTMLIEMARKEMIEQL